MKVCSICHRCFDDDACYCTEDAHPALSEIIDGTTEIVSGYRLERLIESNVRYRTFRATHSATGRYCRIRILPSADSDAFLVEARAASSLFHANAADVYEAGSLESGHLFVVTEDVDGRTVRELLDDGGIPELLTTVEIVRQTAEAIHALHLKGLIHRAVRPENIVLSKDTDGSRLVRVLNIDFGGVIERSLVSNKFLIDTALDSLRYFSPEQCLDGTVGLRSDIYSLGVVLYEMLTGVPPFAAAKATALIEMHRNARPPDVRIDDFELRMLITHTLMESLTKRPEHRQSSANAFARQLRHVEQLATHVSTPPPAGEVPPEPARSTERKHVHITAYEELDVFQIPPAPVESIRMAARPEVASAFVHQEPTSTASEPAIEKFVAPPAVESVESVPVANEPTVEKPAATQIFDPLVSRPRVRRRKRHSQPAASIVVTRGNHIIAPKPLSADAETYTGKGSEPVVERKKIAWQTPDDDVPTIEDVRAALSEFDTDQVPSTDVRTAETTGIAVPSIETAGQQVASSRVIEPKSADGVIADRDPRVKTITPRASSEPKNFAPKLPSQKLLLRVSSPPMSAAIDVDEITQVTARPRKIRVPVAQPKPQRQHALARAALPNSTAEALFFPTLLGGSTLAASSESNPLLSAFHTDERAGGDISRRILLAGLAGFVLIAVVLFGNELLSAVRSDKAVTVPIASTSASQPAQASVDPKAAVPVVKRPAKPAAPTTAKVTETKSDRKTPDQPGAGERPQPSGERHQARSARATPAQRVASDSSKTRPGPGRQSVSANKAAASNQNAPTATTRPRIVKTPR